MTISLLKWSSLDAAGRRAALGRPSPESRADLAAKVAQIVDDVRLRGDVALREYSLRFDGVQLDSLRVEAAAFEAA